MGGASEEVAVYQPFFLCRYSRGLSGNKKAGFSEKWSVASSNEKRGLPSQGVTMDICKQIFSVIEHPKQNRGWPC